MQDYSEVAKQPRKRTCSFYARLFEVASLPSGILMGFCYGSLTVKILPPAGLSRTEIVP